MVLATELRPPMQEPIEQLADEKMKWTHPQPRMR
jgi:hypothetical protein